MKTSNYETMRDRMEIRFLEFDQRKMIDIYRLRHDEAYLYLSFVGREYRIGRRSGRVEWSTDGFQTAYHAGYNDSMTIFDVLSRTEPHSLSGRFVPVSGLKGTVHASPGNDLFADAARRFEHRCDSLEEACERLGGTKERVGDVSYRLPLFDFLPVVLQFWDSDEEFGPVVKLMWDENILSYMHFETTFFAAGHLLNRLSEIMDLTE